MANLAKSVSTTRKNFTKAEIDARTKAEQMVVSNQTTPKPNEIVKSNKGMRLAFNKLKKLNEHYTEADSIALNTLVFNLHMRTMNEEELAKLHILDDNYERFIIRIEKFNKQINESMKQLSITLAARYSLANEMAKVMIEQKKLEQMSQVNAITVNPLQSLLEDDDE